jgi:hypothetical protein
MWISKKRLIDNWAKAVALGYRRGYLAGQIEVMNRIWALAQRIEMDTELLLKMRDELMEARPKTLAEKQIEAIL